MNVSHSFKVCFYEIDFSLEPSLLCILYAIEHKNDLELSQSYNTKLDKGAPGNGYSSFESISFKC